VIDAQQEAAVGAAVDDVGVLGVGDDVAALAAGGRLPVALADRRPGGRAAADAQRGIVLLAAEQAERTEARILKARRLSAQVDSANLSTVCDKSELNVPLTGIKLNLPRAASFFIGQTVRRFLPQNQRDVVTS
jgi:hypothetical protein